MDVTLASLAMDINVGAAGPAIERLVALKKAAADLENQFGATGKAAGGAMGSPAGAAAVARSEKSMRSLIQVYGEADVITDQFAMSQEATATILLRNAAAQTAAAKEADQMAKAVQRLTSAYDPLAGEMLKTNQALANAEALYGKGALSAEGYGAAVLGLKGKLNNLQQAHAGGAKSTAAMQQATLNLGRQFTDIGVQLAGGQNPFLILTQQLPQIADGFQVAKMQGLGLKAVISGLVADVAPLIAAFAPWIAGLAAVGAGVWLLIRAHEEHMKRIEAVTKDIAEMNKTLVSTSPWLIETAKQANLAADGTKNFHDWVVRNTSKLGDYKLALRDAAVEEARMNLFKAKNKQQQLVDETFKVVGGVPTYKGEGSGPLGWITGGLDKGYKKFDTAFREAGENVKAYTKELEDMLKAPASAFVPEDKKAASAAAAAAKAAIRADVRGDNTLEAAKAAEVAAQLGLTKDIELIAGIKRQQVEQELAIQKVRLAGQVRTKAIDQTDADAALASYQRTAAIKKNAIGQEAAAALVERDLSQRSQVTAYTDRAISAQLTMAGTAEQVNALEAKALEARQGAEAKALASRTAIQVKTGEIDVAYRQELLGAQMNAAEVEKQVAARQAAVRVQTEALSVAQSGRQNEIDLLDSRGALATSVREQVAIQDRIRDLQYAGAVADQRAIIEQAKLGSTEADIAKDRIAVLAQIYANDVEIAKRQPILLEAYAAAIDAFSGMARSIIDGDIGGSISGLSSTLKQVSGLLGKGGIGDALGSAAAFLGPIGQAVSTVTSVLGAIGQASAEKAQRKLDALNQSVQDLRTANMDSSESVTGALAEANASWNRDLEYSNSMLRAMRSIDSQIGSLANAVGQSIATGGLLDTSSLGLGTTGSGPSALTRILSPIANILPGLFGSKTKTELSDQGLQFNPTTYGQIGSLSGQSYADTISTTTKKLFGIAVGTKVKTNTSTSGLDADLVSQVTGVISALGSGVVAAASAFGDAAGKAAQDALAGATIDLGKLSLTGLSSDEISKLLSATFSKVGDDLAKAGVPGLEQLSKVGEGAFQTLTRVAREYEVTDTSLASIGKTFGVVGLGSIAARDRLVELAGGIDSFVEQTQSFAENFLSEAEQLAPVQRAVTIEMARLGYAGVQTKDQFKSLVMGLDVSTESGAALYASLMSVAPAFAKVADYMVEMEKPTQAVQDALSALSDAYTREADALKTVLEGVSSASSALIDAYSKQAAAFQATIALVDASRDTLITSYTREAEAIKATKDKFADFAKALKAFRETLNTGTLAGLSPEQQYGDTRKLFEETAAKAAAGDQLALGDLQNVSQAYLEASRDYYASSAGYFSDLASVKAATEAAVGYSQGQVDVAQGQLDTLNLLLDSQDGVVDGIAHLGDQTLTLTDGVFTVNSSVLSVVDALAAYQVAATNSVAAQAQLDALNLMLDGQDGVIDGIAHIGDQTLVLTGGIFAVNDNLVSVSGALAAYQQAVIDASGAQAQLDALNLQVEGLLTVNQSVLSVTDAITALRLAQAAQAKALADALAIRNAVQAPTTTTPTTTTPTPTERAADWSSYLSHYADVKTEYDHLDKAGLKASYGITSAEQFAQWHYIQFGKSEGRTPYAKGGVFTNGIVSQPTNFDASVMGEGGRPEAIVPLVRGPQGLGVRTSGGGSDPAQIRLLERIEKVLGQLVVEAKVGTALNSEVARATLTKLDGMIDETARVQRAVAAA